MLVSPAMSALHGAFWRGGTFLYVPKGVKAVAPVHSVLWAVNGRTFTHTLVVLEEGAEAEEMRVSSSNRVRRFHEVLDELLAEFGLQSSFARASSNGRRRLAGGASGAMGRLLGRPSFINASRASGCSGSGPRSLSDMPRR